MGSRDPYREERLARARYIAASERFQDAVRAFDDSGTPMDPGPAAEPYPWTPEQMATVMELARATAVILNRRREWDGMRRDLRHG